MQAVLEEKDLSTALDALKKTVGKSSLPASTCVHLDAQHLSSTVTMRTTDGAYHTIVKVAAKAVPQSGEALVDASLFTGLAKTIDGEFNLDTDGDHLLVGYGKNTARVPGLDAAMAITEPVVGGPDQIVMTAKAFRQMVESVEFARMKKVTSGQEKFADIGVKVESEVLILMATDRERVAYARTDAPGVQDFDIVVPHKAFNDVLSWANQDVTVSITLNQLKFESGPFTYYSPVLAAASFPKYHKHIRHQPDMVEVNRLDLIKALTRADIVTSKSEDEPGIIEFGFGLNLINISGKSTSGSKLDESLLAVSQYVRNVRTYGRHLLDVAKRMKEDTVWIHVDADPKRPLYMFPQGTEDQGHLIMVVTR